MALKAREQTFIGVAAIAGVLVIGWTGPIGGIGIEPFSKTFTEKSAEFSKSQTDLATIETTINTLKQQKVSLQDTKLEMPANKSIRKIDRQAGETEESTKREILNDIISIAQKDSGNTLVSITPDPLPPAPVAPPPPPPPPAPDPNAPPGPPPAPEIKLSDLVSEVPYTVVMKGSYKSINQFLDDLKGYNNIVEVNRIEIAPSNDPQGSGDPTKPLKATFKVILIIDKT